MVVKDKFDGFTVTVFLDEEGSWVAHFNELPNISAFGSTTLMALNELEKAWQAVQESYKKNHQPIPIAPARREYSGHFNVRV